MRIVSLIASSTEIVHALGFGDDMVGRSHECDFPLKVKNLPVCTEPKFKVEGSSYEIDQRVKEIVQESLSVYRVDADKLNELQPTHIFTQDQCEVCAVSLKDVEDAACNLITSNPKIVSLHPDSLKDIFEDIRRVANSLNAEVVGEALITNLKARMQAVVDRVGKLKARPRVALIEWIDPLMAGGNWMPELIEMAGGVNLFGVAGEHSPWMKWEDLVASDPDIIIVSPCGFGIERTMQEMHLLSERPEFATLRAAKVGKIFIADGNQYFNRPGPRVLDSLEILAEIFHLGVVNYGHESIGWIRFSAAALPAPLK